MKVRRHGTIEPVTSGSEQQRHEAICAAGYKIEHDNRRGLASRHVQFLAFGGTIGAGLFLGSGEYIQTAGPSLILAYGIAGAMVFIITRCLAEMALTTPGRGTFVSYIADYLGPRCAFVGGWSYWFASVLAGMAELTAAGALAHAWLPVLPQWVPTLAALAGLATLNRLHVRTLGEFEFWITLLKVLALMLFIVLGVVVLWTPLATRPPEATLSNLWSHGGFFATGLGGFAMVLPFALASFAGAELIGIAAAETTNPAQTLPRAVNALVPRVLIFYVGAMIIAMTIVPWTEFSGAASPFVRVLEELRMPSITIMMNAVLITALLSSCNSVLFGASRVLRSLANMGGAPAWLETTNQRGAPAQGALLSTAAILVTIVLNYFAPARAFGLLFSAAVVCVMINWMLSVTAHLRFRAQSRHVALPLRYRIPAFVHILVIAYAALVVVILAHNPRFRVALVVDAIFLAVLSLIAYLRVGIVQKSRP